MLFSQMSGRSGGHSLARAGYGVICYGMGCYKKQGLELNGDTCLPAIVSIITAKPLGSKQGGNHGETRFLLLKVSVKKVFQLESK